MKVKIGVGRPPRCK